MKRCFERVRARVGGLIVGVLIMVVPGSVSAQSRCEPEQARLADAAYQRADFDGVKQLLAGCIPAGFSESVDRIAALRLMTLTYLAEDSVEVARSYVRLLLREDSGYRARQEIDPPRMVNLVSDERPPWIAWLWKGNSLQRWIGRTALVGAAVSIPLLLKPEPPRSPLALPPEMPVPGN